MNGCTGDPIMMGEAVSADAIDLDFSALQTRIHKPFATDTTFFFEREWEGVQFANSRPEG